MRLFPATVDPLLSFWHIANFFAPALGCGFLAAALAKLFWRRELAVVRWWRLGVIVAMAMAAVAIAGLLVFAHDGRMATYAGMVVAGAGALWWAGFRRRGTF